MFFFLNVKCHQCSTMRGLYKHAVWIVQTRAWIVQICNIDCANIQHGLCKHAAWIVQTCSMNCAIAETLFALHSDYKCFPTVK